jgi:hypothetical protein
MKLRENWNRSKEVLAAYLRQGMHELGAFFTNGTLVQPPEYGMAWTKPPGMVSDGLRGKGEVTPNRDDASPGLVDEFLNRSRGQEHTQERQAPEMER